MVQLTELNGTEYGLMGTTVDDVVIRLSEPHLDIIDGRSQYSIFCLETPEVVLRGTRFFHPDDHKYWPDWEDLKNPLLLEEHTNYTKDATTDPLHFFQLGAINHSNENRTLTAVAIYREWGLRDPRQGEYFRWHKEKERIRQTVENGVEAVLDYVLGCVFGGTLETGYETTEEIRKYIDRLKKEVLDPETDQQRWMALLDLSTRLGPKDKKQEFWPHFRYILKAIS